MGEKKEDRAYESYTPEAIRVGPHHEVTAGQWKSVVEGFGFHTYVVMKDGSIIESSEWRPLPGSDVVDASILHKPTVELMKRLRRVSLGMQKVKLINEIGKATDAKTEDAPRQPTKEEINDRLDTTHDLSQYSDLVKTVLRGLQDQGGVRPYSPEDEIDKATEIKTEVAPVQPTKEQCLAELNQPRCEVAFKPGDVVYHKIHYCQSMAVRIHGSLHSPWVMTVHKSLGGGYFETKRWHSDHGFIDGVFHADELVKLPPPAAKE